MRVKDSLSDLIGKTIRGVVVAHNGDGHPRSRVFLAFSDGTAFEFWAEEEDVSVASGLVQYSVDQLIEMLKRRENTQVRTFRAPHEDPDAVQRDLLSDQSKDR